jgi:DNA modification methylase
MGKSIKIKDLPDDKNYNKGTEFGGSLIEKSLRKLGAGRSILLDKNNRIIAGNKTIENAGAIGLEDVIVVETTGNQIVAVKRTDIDLDSKKGREMALADNATAKANIDWDVEALNEDWSTEEQKEWGVEFPDFAVNLEAEEDDYEIPSEIVTDIVLGDLFEIGQHRLLCGDSTNADDVAKLMNGQKADLLFTDPPYNVAFNGRSGKFDVIKNDDLPEKEFEDFINAFIAILSLIKPQTYYICCNWAFYGVLQLKLKPKACIVWAKNVFGLGRGYRHQHEFILFDGFIDASITNESDLWEIAKDTNYKHPTQKPVAISARAIKNSSKDGNIVLDLFCGSGSTMVAAHQLNRKCYGMELDPKYCQVIVDRMRKLDPSIEIKRNGQPYISNKAEINAI